MSAWGPILCATDFSGPSNDAAHRAGRMAKETGAALTLIHVVPGSGLGAVRRRLAPGSVDDGPMHRDVEQRLRQLSDELAVAWGVQCGTVHAIGSVADEVLFEASALQAGVLVVGARGAGRLRRLFLGSTADRLLRRSVRPVLVVRRPAAEPYVRALVALDFSSSSMSVLIAAKRAAPQAQFILMHVRDPSPAQPGPDLAEAAGSRATDAAQRLKELGDAAGLAPSAWEACVVDGDPSQQILDRARECHLLALGKHGRTLTEDLLLGSVTQHMIAEGSSDLLICPAGRD